MKNNLMTLVCLTVLMLTKGWSQQNIVNHFTSKQYHAHPLMWDMVEDKRGYLWFANNDGVVRFDGNNWKTFATPNPVRSLVITDQYEIFVACIEDFGVLTFTQEGGTSFMSFKSQLDASGTSTGGNEKVWMKDGHVYFSSDHSIFTVTDSEEGYKLKIVDAEKNLGCGFVQDKLFSNHVRVGFGWVQNGRFLPVINGGELAGKQIVQTLRMDGFTLVFTNYDGVYKLTQNTFEKIQQGDLMDWANKGIAGVVQLNSKQFAVATYHDGVKLFNTSFQAVGSLVLPSREIFAMGVDHEQSIWVAHRKGITQVLINFPVVMFQYPEITGSINDLQKLGDVLYLSATNGLFAIRSSTPNQLMPVQGITGECWDITIYKNTLYAATTNGLYVVNGMQAKCILPNEIVLYLQEGNRTGKLYVFGVSRSVILDESGRMEDISKLKVGANSVYESSDGTSWFGTNHHGVVSLPVRKQEVSPEGLTTGEVRIRSLDGKPFFQHKEGVYSFDGSSFVKDDHLSLIWLGIRNKDVVLSANIWLFTDNEWKQLVNGKSVSKSNAFALSGKPTAHLTDGHSEWFAAEDILYRMESHDTHQQAIHVNISCVEYGDTGTAFSGVFVSEKNETTIAQERVLDIDFNEQPVTVFFGLNSFLNPIKNQYRYKIKQLTNQWSQWSGDAKLPLNGLSGGQYTVVVQARNAAGVESEESEYTIYIKPAWYLSGIAFMVYILAFIMVMYGLAMLYNKRLVSKNNELEKRVQARTIELEEEKQKSDALLLNILPEGVAEELKNKGYAEAKQYDHVTVLFTDMVNFTGISEQMSPRELVAEIHKNFTAFDAIIEKHGLEKIKTIGDAYLAVCGLPIEQEEHAKRVVAAAIDIRDYMNTSQGKFEIRAGIHSGPVVAGIVGVKKYAYDIWGDTVNMAARMEQNSEAGKINISAATYELIKDSFKCEYRGKIKAKNKGEVDMYFVSLTSP